ncbi:MAG: type II toxin-antitoxin system PemK/MazF family toxin [Vicinamibacteria bacterium]
MIVAEVTPSVRSIPQELKVGRDEGLAGAFVVNLDNIHVVAKAVLGERIGRLSSMRFREVKRAAGYALDGEELKTL